jgi:hypothetical protein
MEPYDSIGRMTSKARQEAEEAATSEAEHAFDTALWAVLKTIKGRGSKAARAALYDLETKFKAEMGIEE